MWLKIDLQKCEVCMSDPLHTNTGFRNEHQQITFLEDLST